MRCEKKYLGEGRLLKIANQLVMCSNQRPEFGTHHDLSKVHIAKTNHLGYGRFSGDLICSRRMSQVQNQTYPMNSNYPIHLVLSTVSLPFVFPFYGGQGTKASASFSCCERLGAPGNPSVMKKCDVKRKDLGK